MRKKIFELIHGVHKNDRRGIIYDITMLLFAIASIVPLAFKEQSTALYWVDKITVSIFIADYFLGLITADLHYPKLKGWAFALYPFTPKAIIHLLGILPSLKLIGKGFKVLKLLRLLRIFPVLREVRYVFHPKNSRVMSGLIKRYRRILITVCVLAAIYVPVSALIIFTLHPEEFSSYGEALRWGLYNLTNSAYGDIYPNSAAGRVINFISSALGIGLFGFLAGMLTAGYMHEVGKDSDDDQP